MRNRQSHRAAILVGLLLASVLLVTVGPLFLGKFSMDVLTRSMIYAMLAVTVDLLWGFAGALTFGQSAFFGVGAYAAAIVLTQLGATAQGICLALSAAIIIPLLLGAAVGWLSFYHGSTPLYATVISLVVPIVVTQLVFSGGEWTGSSSGLVGYDTLPLSVENYFRLVGLVLIAIVGLALAFVRSDRGRLLLAIRDNETRLSYLGLKPTRVMIVLTAVLAAVCGLAGFLFANASDVVAPENTGFVFGTELVVWTALGGRGTIIGPVLGAIGVDYLSATLSGDLPFLWQLIVGVIFVVMIIFLPQGLASLIPAKFRRTVGGRSFSALEAEAPQQDALSGRPLLSVKGLGRSFGSLNVLSQIDLDVRPGELVSLVGPNGAGKTTLMRCLSDGTEPYKGTVAVDGQDIAGMTPTRVVGLGLGRKFQIASAFDSLTVGECMRIARMRSHKTKGLAVTREVALPAPALDILRLTALDQMASHPVLTLSHGQKQALELAMVVAMNPRLILLDEPTAGLTKTERTTIGNILRKLTSELGLAAILVEHDLDFVREISSRIVVLHQGELVLDGSVDEVIQSETVRAIYSGGGHA